MKFLNVDFSLNGRALSSEDIILLTFINITFEYDYSLGGFDIRSYCNFPEAPKVGEMLLKNISVFIKDKLMN